MKPFYLTILSFILLYSCGEHSAENETVADNDLPKTNTQTTEDSVQTDKEEAVDVFQLFKATEAEIANITPKESERIIKDINVCTVKDFDGIKKSISCFDGGTKAQECDIYYSEGKAITGIVKLEFYNASPANPSAFDESKTNKYEMKLHFKDGDLNSIEKVLNMEDQPITMKESHKKYWEILAEAAG